MSEVGFLELIVLFAIGLVVLGPERLPRVANKIGGWVGQARRMTRVMKRQLEDELDFEKDFDIKPPARTEHANPGTYKPPVPPAPPAPPAEEHDDTYSPAHDPDSPGTGVTADEPPQTEDEDAASRDVEDKGPA